MFPPLFGPKEAFYQEDAATKRIVEDLPPVPAPVAPAQAPKAKKKDLRAKIKKDLADKPNLLRRALTLIADDSDIDAIMTFNPAELSLQDPSGNCASVMRGLYSSPKIREAIDKGDPVAMTREAEKLNTFVSRQYMAAADLAEKDTPHHRTAFAVEPKLKQKPMPEQYDGSNWLAVVGKPGGMLHSYGMVKTPSPAPMPMQCTAMNASGLGWQGPCKAVYRVMREEVRRHQKAGLAPQTFSSPMSASRKKAGKS